MRTLILMSALSALAMADYTLTMKMDGVEQKFYYKDDAHMLLESKENGHKVAQLFNNGKLYTVTNVNGKKRYMDMSAMLSQMSQMGAGQESMKKPKIEVISKGASKTVAGIKAREWTIKFKERGHTVTDKVFVTDNKDLRKALGGFSKFMSKMTGSKNNENMYEVKEGYVMVAGDGFKITNFDTKDLPDTLFTANAAAKVPSIGQIKKPVIHIKKPPVCAIVGKHGKAKMLLSMIKQSVDGWKLIDSATCADMMGMHLENALYKKGDGYIHLSLSVNDPHNQGLIATYKVRGLSITGLKRGKLQGHRFQMAHLDMAGVKALDIKLPNAMLELTATDNVTDDLEKEADALLNLSKFKPVKRTKANPQDALKDLGKMFGGSKHQNGANMPSQKDLQKMQDMMKQMMGK